MAVKKSTDLSIPQSPNTPTQNNIHIYLSLTLPLLIHLNTLHSHPLTVPYPPSRQPRIPRRPKLQRRRRTLIRPRLVVLAILEIAIGASNRDVQDQVEGLVERRVAVQRTNGVALVCSRL